MRITVIGAGYVGLPVATVFAERGHEVVLCEKNVSWAESIKRGVIPFNEPGLESLVVKNIDKRKLTVNSDGLEAGCKDTDICFVAVSTDSSKNSILRSVVKEVAKIVEDRVLIVLKSTLPIGLADQLAEEIGNGVKIAVNPEFLREGNAIEDFGNPERIVVGVTDQRSEQVLREVYRNWIERDVKWIATNRTTASIIKLVSNYWLAMRVAAINEVMDLCEVTTTDIKDVLEGIKADSRIGSHYLNPGIGFGGACLPKDCELLIAGARELDSPLKIAEAVATTNNARVAKIVAKIEHKFAGLSSPTIAVWGLTFKPDSGDTRSSMALKIATALSKSRLQPKLNIYDPYLADLPKELNGAKISADWRSSLRDADGLVTLTKHGTYTTIGYDDLMKYPVAERICDFASVWS